MKVKILSFLALAIVFASCKNDDNNTTVDNTKVYLLGSISDPGISGTATFSENEDGSITVELALNGTTAGDSHPSHIHYNTAAEGGGIAVSLNPVEGDTGRSTTTFSALDGDLPISYDEILNFDGYINVHLSEVDLETLVAQGDIGQNELTGNSASHVLTVLTPDADSGIATFYERANGETLLVIAMEGTAEVNSHPCHIHTGTVEDPGGIVVSLNPVNGATGRSVTNISSFDEAVGGGDFLYADALTYGGYINVHLSAADLVTIVAQTNIGSSGTQ